MTTTSQNQDASDKPVSSTDTKTEATKDTKTVPLGEHIELRQKLRETNERLAAMEARLAQSANATDSAAPKAPLDDDTRKIIVELQEDKRITSLVDELGLFDRAQGAKVAGILKDLPKLSPAEALTIAAARDPEAFKDRGQAGNAQASHGSLRPRPGSQPAIQQESDHVARAKYVASLAGKDKRQHRAYADNMVGAHLAKAMGWEHQKMPIPKQ